MKNLKTALKGLVQRFKTIVCKNAKVSRLYFLNKTTTKFDQL